MECETASDFRRQRVTVMGLGRFGGGVGAVQFLAERGARVTVTDAASESALSESLAQLDGLPIAALHLGGHLEEDFRAADLVVVNPAVPRDHPFLAVARGAGVPLSSEMNLFWQFNRGRVVAVTGSNGKSTTTAMIHAILQAAGMRAWLGGNIGQSLLPVVDDIRPDDWCVLELSSFQLEDLDRIQAAPDVAVVTNFSPNHLDRHGTIEAYRSAKQSILRWQSGEQTAVLNANDADVREWSTRGERWYFGDAGDISKTATRCVAAKGHNEESRDNSCDSTSRSLSNACELPIRDWLHLPGEHNVQNALAAAAATLAIGVTVDDIKSGLENYRALPHRLQFVAEVNARRFYNDSLATTPESVGAALAAFNQPVVLLAGGYDKKIDLGPLANLISGGAKGVALMGQTAEPLLALLKANPGSLPMRCCENFEAAFAWAVEQSAPGDVVLLSPGCASYDWFRNFAERGERFTELVRTLM